MTWILAGIILFTAIINKITLKYGFDKLNYNLDVSKKAAEIGEDISVTSTFENNKGLTVTFLQVDERYPKGFNVENYNYTLYILPYQRVKRTYQIVGMERGLYQIKGSSLSLGDFIGFKMLYKNINVGKDIVILPRKIDIKKSLIPMGSLNGDVSVRRWIIDDPNMIIGIRDYTGNEPQKYIHWQSSLKHGKLMVKNFDFTTDNSIIIVLNIETIKPFWMGIEKESIENSISLVRGIMEELESKKIPYGFITNAFGNSSTTSQFYYPGLGRNQLSFLLEMLGRINYGISSTFEDLLTEIINRRNSYSTFVVVTPKVFTSYIDKLNKLSKASTKVILISLESINMDKLDKGIIKYGVKL